METLATRTAGLHRAFALRSGDPAFDPEPFTADDFSQWQARVKSEAEETMKVVQSSSVSLERVVRKIKSVPPPTKPTFKTRHHGDYHLGQVLITNNDFVIIDFEGEPNRPLDDSRRKAAPLRDVAGMLRSFSYAKWSAAKRLAEGEPARERLAALLDAWETETRRAFLDSYFSALQQDAGDVRGVLELAELEKVLYELRYEAANRPDWLHIPLQGLLGVLNRGPGERP
jgi:maltose alpha-D-glucosyltransferase/alpha-amylase